jgi:hypothetical protein
MKKHPFVVYGFLIIGAAILFGTPPAWTQDRSSDEPVAAPAAEEPAPADVGMEETTAPVEAPAEMTTEEPTGQAGEAVTGETETAPAEMTTEEPTGQAGEAVSGETETTPAETKMEAPSGQAEEAVSGETETAPAETKMEAPSGQAEEGLPAEAPPVPGEVAVEAPSQPGETIRYTVQPGDTLWDITRSIWSDPFLWPKTWKNNPYIENPDLIYPGNVLEFPPDLAGPVEAAEAAPPVEEAPPAVEEAPPVEEEAVAEEEAPAAEEEGPTAEKKVDIPVIGAQVAPPKEPDFSSLASNGFILRRGVGAGTLVAGKLARTVFGTHDLVYIRPGGEQPLSTGDRMVLIRKVRKVYHPQTNRYIGDLYHVLGVAKVTEDKEKIKVAEVTKSFREIGLNDSAVPYGLLESTLQTAGEASMEGAADGDKGYIVEVKEAHETQSISDVVYLDRGVRDGLEKGHRLDVIRMGRAISHGDHLPARKIGQVEVLIALDSTSTARVIESTEPIHKGDRIESAGQP